jgi:antitoxin YefM
MSTLTAAEVRDNLDTILDEVVSTREPVLIKRRGKEDIAIIAADELSGLMETAHLLSSPANARRIYESLDRISKGGGVEMTMEEIRKAVGCDDAQA